MDAQGHKPILNGSRYVCANCGKDLLDVSIIAKLRTLIDVDRVKLGAVINRLPHDSALMQCLATGDARKVIAAYKFADKMNDFLMNPNARPDLQNPKAQGFLNSVKNQYWNSKTDALMPWLTREWKKGRVQQTPSGLQFQGSPDYDYQDIKGNVTNWHNLTEPELNHWADWYESNHPSRQGKDIMQMESPDMHQTIADWDRDMRNKAGSSAQIRGDIEHSYPDGWTVQRLTNPAQLKEEGDAMGHCVGGSAYGERCQRGDSLIYSLRDPHNQPHATWEVTPHWHEGPDGKLYSTAEFDPDFTTVPSQMQGTMEQIQGKENRAPIPAYQQRIKDYYESKFPKSEYRPQWSAPDINVLDDLFADDNDDYVSYHPGDYGLKTPDFDIDWENVVSEFADPPEASYSEPDPHELVEKAIENKQLPNLKKVIEKVKNNLQEDREQDLENSWYPEDYDVSPEAERDAFEDYVRNGLKEWAPIKRLHDLETAIAEQDLRKQGGQSELRVPYVSHIHPSGSPCDCLFHRPSAEWHEAATVTDEPGRCSVCGDPLSHGKCQRCDWGGPNGMGSNDPIPDPTKEIKPFIGES